MSNTSYQDRLASIHWGDLSIKRSYRPFLRYLEALSEQRSFSSPDDVPRFQRPGKFCIRCHHGNAEYYEGHGREKRCSVQGKRNPSIVQGYRRTHHPRAIRRPTKAPQATTVQAIERSIKNAIVDKNPSVSSAALVSSYHLLPIARDLVRRWQSETQEAASSSKSSGAFSLGFSTSGSQQALQPSTHFMNQYHAIGLLYQMRSHDRMALVKMVQQFGTPGAVKSPAGTILLVRLAAKLIEDDPSLRRPMMQLLDGWLRHKAEMVNFEAAKAICNLRDVTDAEMTQAIHTLQLFLTSPRAVTKFAAIRILHNVASFKPQAVQSCNPDIETLISNSNRSIATFAITTLLKTGNEGSVDRLMKQISSFMADITDEFKITIVEAIRTLCLKFPSKQAGMLTFLSGILRDEGGYEFKRSVVESMFDLIKFVPGSKEDGRSHKESRHFSRLMNTALAHLCEFIEDCEFTKLAVRILHLLGVEGPKTSHPTKYIRYIYNRVVLENALVRAAAVTALAKFGVGQKDPEVKRSVTVLLTRCLDDTDDEVRDRAALNLRLMAEEDEMANRFIKNGTSKRTSNAIGPADWNRRFDVLLVNLRAPARDVCDCG